MNVSVILLFLASFLVGCVMLQFSKTSYRTVFVYPTPKNYNSIQYKSDDGTCFHLQSSKTKCDGPITDIP